MAEKQIDSPRGYSSQRNSQSASSLPRGEPTAQPGWPSSPDIAVETHCQFPLAPPRRFLYPAVLLLLAEQPRHGYPLVEALTELGLGRIDRPSVYRALAELERDELIYSWDEAPHAGSTRHTHALTERGVEVLEAWMSVVAQERACLDSVLQRYWYCNAHRLVGLGLPELGQDEEHSRNKAAVERRQPVLARDLQASVHSEPDPRLGFETTSRADATSRAGAPAAGASRARSEAGLGITEPIADRSSSPGQAVTSLGTLHRRSTGTTNSATERGRETSRIRFELATDRSSLVVEARSSVGPIAFTLHGLTGTVEVNLNRGMIVTSPPPHAHLEAALSRLRSGNALYDSELLRRLDSRKFPIVTVDLHAISRLGEGNCYDLRGDMTLKGVTRTMQGLVTATVTEIERGASGHPLTDRRLTVIGDQVLDVRYFSMTVPKMVLFKIYPDVRIHLHLEADSFD